MKVNTGNNRLCSYTFMKIDDTAYFICTHFVCVKSRPWIQHEPYLKKKHSYASYWPD